MLDEADSYLRKLRRENLPVRAENRRAPRGTRRRWHGRYDPLLRASLLRRRVRGPQRPRAGRIIEGSKRPLERPAIYAPPEPLLRARSKLSVRRHKANGTSPPLRKPPP